MLEKPGELSWDRLDGGRYSFLAGAAFLFDRRRAIALLEIGQNDRGNELLLAVVIEFNNDLLVITRHHCAESEFPVLDLGAIGVRRLSCHNMKTDSFTIYYQELSSFALTE